MSSVYCSSCKYSAVYANLLTTIVFLYYIYFLEDKGDLQARSWFCNQIFSANDFENLEQRQDIINNGIIKIMKLRYKTSEILLVFGMVICMVVTIHAASLVNSMAVVALYEENYKYEAIFWTYHSEIQIDEFTNGLPSSRLTPWNMTPLDIDKIAECASETPFDVKLNVKFQVGRNTDTTFVEIRFEEFTHKEKLAQGSYTTSSDSTNGKLYISKAVLPYIEQKDGKDVISLNGMLVDVAGVIEGTILTEFDNTIILYYEDCGEALKQKINTAILEEYYNELPPEIVLLSDTTDPSVSWENNVSIFEKANLVSYLYNNNYMGSKDNVFSNFSMVFIVVLYAFSAINLSVLCSFWIKNRKKELLIRKIHGETNLRIAGMIIKDFLKIILYAIFLSVPVELIISLFWTDAKSSLHNIAITALVFIVSMGLLIMLIALTALAAYKKISLVGQIHE